VGEQGGEEERVAVGVSAQLRGEVFGRCVTGAQRDQFAHLAVVETADLDDGDRAGRADIAEQVGGSLPESPRRAVASSAVLGTALRAR
jgi:hypothetical protein